jgi:hypothetical protein
MTQTKKSHIQLRVSAREKSAVRAAAQRAGMEMSAWILSRLLPPLQQQFSDKVRTLTHCEGDAVKRRYALADLNDFLAHVSPADLDDVLLVTPLLPKSPLIANYLAAMVELVCNSEKTATPMWTRQIEPLSEPYFGTELLSLRLYLLRASPPSFKRRNLFVDTSVGARV